MEHWLFSCRRCGQAARCDVSLGSYCSERCARLAARDMTRAGQRVTLPDRPCQVSVPSTAKHLRGSPDA